MKVIKLNKYIFDVFFNDGWDHCVRINKSPSGFIKVIKNYSTEPLPKNFYQLLKELVA